MLFKGHYGKQSVLKVVLMMRKKKMKKEGKSEMKSNDPKTDEK